MGDLLSEIEQRLDLMLDKMPPAMWGGPEAYELQVILLLELLYRRDSERFMDRYCRFLADRHPELGPRPLSAVHQDHSVLTTELRAFRAQLEEERRGQGKLG